MKQLIFPPLKFLQINETNSELKRSNRESYSYFNMKFKETFLWNIQKVILHRTKNIKEFTKNFVMKLSIQICVNRRADPKKMFTTNEVKRGQTKVTTFEGSDSWHDMTNTAIVTSQCAVDFYQDKQIFCVKSLLRMQMPRLTLVLSYNSLETIYRSDKETFCCPVTSNILAEDFFFHFCPIIWKKKKRKKDKRDYRITSEWKCILKWKKL